MVRIAVLGLGSRGKNYGGHLSRNPNVRIVSVCDKYRNKIDKVKGKWNVPEDKCFTSDEEFCAIMDGLEKHIEARFSPMAANGRERYIPYASTWLRRKAWKDDPVSYTPDRVRQQGRVEKLPEYMKNPPKESKDASPEYIEAFRKMLKLRAVVMDIDNLQSGYMTDEKRAKLEKILSQHTEEEWRGMYKDAQDALEKIQNAEEEE